MSFENLSLRRKSRELELDVCIKNDQPTLTVKVLNEELIGCRASIEIYTNLVLNGHYSALISKPKAFSRQLNRRFLGGVNFNELKEQNQVQLKLNGFAPVDMTLSSLKAVTEFNCTIYGANQIHKYTLTPLKPVESKSTLETSILTPKDTYSLSKNIKKLPLFHRLMANFWAYMAIILVLIFTFIGLHDQFVSNDQAWLFDKINNHGGGRRRGGGLLLPLILTILFTSASYMLLTRFMKNELKNYISSFYVKWPKLLSIDSQIKIKDILVGHLNSDIDYLTVRLVAGNQYLFIYGNKVANRPFAYNHLIAITRNEGFTNEVKLFEKKLMNLKKGTQLRDYLDDKDIALMEPFFNQVLPSIKYGFRKWIKPRLELQMIHPDLIDFEEVNNKTKFNQSDFACFKQCEMDDK